MKHLSITYDGVCVFDGEVAEFTWTDSANTVTVTGKARPTRGAAGGGIFDAIVSASKRQTQQQATEYRQSAEDENK